MGAHAHFIIVVSRYFFSEVILTQAHLSTHHTIINTFLSIAHMGYSIPSQIIAMPQHRMEIDTSHHATPNSVFVLFEASTSHKSAVQYSSLRYSTVPMNAR